MNSILDKIMEEQQALNNPELKNYMIEEDNDFSNATINTNQQLDDIVNNLSSLNIIKTTENDIDIVNNETSLKNTKTNNDSEIKVFNENNYDNILNEMQTIESDMEDAIKNADILSKEVSDSVKHYLKIRNNNRNGILYHGVPDVLNAAARLLDLTINGRAKLINAKKLRASVLKDMSGGSNNNDVNLSMLLGDD